jgi:predicted ATPase/class 3 adenylate cyclase
VQGPSVLPMGEAGVVRGLPSGTVTFLFTDIEGSTPLWDAHPQAMREALTRHDEIVRKAIDTADGYIFSTGGDGFGAVFQRAGNAVAASVGAQRDLAAEPWPDDVELRVRMGLHTGEVQERDGDYFGPPVNRAARIMGAANGSQVVVSDLTAGLLGDSPGVGLVDLGSAQLKGVVEPIHVYGVDADEARWIDRPLVSTQTSAGNLPIPQTELFTDLVALQERVSALADARLVTLTGSGGVGKTRAAMEIGWLVIDDFVDGIWMVELAPVADPDMVIAALASTMSIQPQPGMSLVESIVDWCLGRRMLLIIDNCEHVLDPVIEVVTAIVAGCPTVTIIATSREPLGVDGERVNRIPSLDESFAVELFCDRARAADGNFAVTGNDVEDIAAICARVDGIPLAIELAAARIRLMSPAEIVERLSDGLEVIDGGTGGDRHETLHETMRWSYDLLAPAEATLFKRSSVFTGGFDLAAAQAVCGHDAEPGDIPELVMALLDKSMLVSDEIEGHRRFRMLESLREFAHGELTESGATSDVQRRHAAHYRDLAEREGVRLFSPAEPDVWRILDVEWSNLRTALDTFEDLDDLDGGTELVVSLVWFATLSMRFELFTWAEELLQVDGIEQHRRFTDLCGAAAVGAYFTLDGQVAERAEAGLAVDPSDPEGFCRSALASVFLNNVHTAEASDELTSAWLDTDPQPVGSRMWAHGFRTFHLVIHDPGPAMVDHAKVLSDLAASTGSVSARAVAAWANGQVQSFTDLEVGMQTWSEGREWARSISAHHLLDQLLVGLLLHVTARRGELLGTLERCRDALNDALDQHYYAGASHLLGVTAIALSRTGDARTGGRLVGAMIENGHLPRRNARSELETSLGDDLEDLLAMGRSMSITQAGNLAIDALDQAIDRERETAT